MLEAPRNKFRCSPEYQPIMRQLGLDAEAVFTHPEIKVWRKLPDRENCTLDAKLPDGKPIRLHIKRYAPARGFTTPADDEAKGIQALAVEKIPALELIGWGKILDGRSFVITLDLTGYQPADKLIASGTPFDKLLLPTADLAARLHNANLHHRDLYLCHFFAKIDADTVDLKLIDAARVRRLPGFFTRNRWIVKDLAQYWYSTTQLPITDTQRTQWLERYAQQRNLKSTNRLRRQIEKKSAWIARHDASLRAKQPTRNISIPH